MKTIKVYTGNLVASVTVLAQPWGEGHVARVASARTCQPITSRPSTTTGTSAR